MDAEARFDSPSTAFAPLRLRMHPGGHAIDVTAPDVLLGRHSESNLCMPLPDISRRHCRFVHSAAGWELIDLGSLNGVYVNGVRVQRAVLKPGDNIRICSLEFEVETVDASSGGLRHDVQTIVEAMRSPARKAS